MQYKANKKITDENYDKSLAVKCVNGTFVGRKADGVIVYRGIPFVSRWESAAGKHRQSLSRMTAYTRLISTAKAPASTRTSAMWRTPWSIRGKTACI